MATNPTLLLVPIAQNGTKNAIPENQATPGNGLMSQSTGFPAECSLPLGAGGVAPERADFNGAFYLLGGVAFYAQKGWQFEFDAGQSYFAGCIVRDTINGLLYECINDVAAGGSAPSADSVHWRISGNPVGTIISYAGAGTLGGWLNCDGSAISRTSYSNLFSAIGTTYGAGDGSTTFNLPNMIDKYPEGSTTAGTVKGAGLPDIGGSFSSIMTSMTSGTPPTSGAFVAYPNIDKEGAIGTSRIVSSFAFSASRANAIYGNSNTVTPPTLTLRFFIKY